MSASCRRSVIRAARLALAIVAFTASIVLLSRRRTERLVSGTATANAVRVVSVIALEPLEYPVGHQRDIGSGPGMGALSSVELWDFERQKRRGENVRGVLASISGRRDLNPRPPEPHSAQGDTKQRQSVGFQRLSERRRRFTEQKCRTMPGETAPQTAPQYHTLSRRPSKETESDVLLFFIDARDRRSRDLLGFQNYRKAPCRT
jgi:hypothetical protein